MNIYLAIKSGFVRTVAAWKAVIIYWLVSLFLSWMIMVPLKAGFKTAIGTSMITEKLTKGINIDVVGDLGRNFKSMISSLSSGIIMLLLTAILINIFLSGGVFNSLKQNAGKFSPSEFFRGSAINFWPFSMVLGLIYLIMLFLIIGVIVVPVSVVNSMENAPEGIVFKTLWISAALFLVSGSILLLVADYARAWQVLKYRNMAFRAFGFGFSQTFRIFLASFPLMILVLLLQGFTIWIIYKLVSAFTPSNGGGVFLLFILSQLSLITRIFIRILRYASVTSLMELYPVKPPVQRGDALNPQSWHPSDTPGEAGGPG
jgi:hypothetical protein